MGDEAGSLTVKGYRRIELRDRSYATANVAWFLYHGTWPVTELDHEDRVRDHNWISNLRPASRFEQVVNTEMRADNKSGFKGVHQVGRRWKAQINIKGKRTCLGTFDTPELAAAAYAEAAKIHHGNFARAA